MKIKRKIYIINECEEKFVKKEKMEKIKRKSIYIKRKKEKKRRGKEGSYEKWRKKKGLGEGNG